MSIPRELKFCMKEYNYNLFQNLSIFWTHPNDHLQRSHKVLNNVAEFHYPFFHRLTPAYGLIMLVLSTLFLHLSSGPNWAFMEGQSMACQEQWWKNLLYINNFFSLT